MAYDPHKEDYQRLGLRFLQSFDGQDPLTASRAFATFGRRFVQDRDNLPQSDSDRAFHLVAEATTLIDYQLPFATDEEAETLVSRAHTLLDEAISLDPDCYDAVRMKVAAEMPSFEAYYDFLRSGATDAKTSCERRREEALKDPVGERAALAANIAVRPYLRWIAALASKAVICGRNREALAFAEEAFALDPDDSADVSFTAALAYAKLEDAQGLDLLEKRLSHNARGPLQSNAWFRLAHASLAYRRRDFPTARSRLKELAEAYPQAPLTLGQQRELPDGVFARLAVQPYSEDELIIAVSEATVLFQEGRDALGRGSFGSWVLLEALSLATKDQLIEMGDLVEAAASAAHGGPLLQGGAA